MPDGNILDPRQNPSEKRYGICISALGNRYYYRKEVADDSRYWTQGYPIQITGINNELATITKHPTIPPGAVVTACTTAAKSHFKGTTIPPDPGSPEP
jgi:hypothetical protein